MKVKGPDPETFRDLIRKMAQSPREHVMLGDNMQLSKLARRHGLSTETARGILREEDWTLEPTPSGALKVWRPPKAEEED